MNYEEIGNLNVYGILSCFLFSSVHLYITHAWSEEK